MYLVANRQNHWVVTLGVRRLDEIESEHVSTSRAGRSGDFHEVFDEPPNVRPSGRKPIDSSFEEPGNGHYRAKKPLPYRYLPVVVGIAIRHVVDEIVKTGQRAASASLADASATGAIGATGSSGRTASRIIRVEIVRRDFKRGIAGDNRHRGRWYGSIARLARETAVVRSTSLETRLDASQVVNSYRSVVPGEIDLRIDESRNAYEPLRF